MTIEGKKFRDLSVEEREVVMGFSDTEIESLKTGGLNLERADLLVENVIGIYSLPLGLAKDFVINGKKYDVPMVTEEPSIIASSSKAAKIFKLSGGVETFSTEPIGTGQIQILPNSNEEISKIIKRVDENKKTLISGANSIVPNLVGRGGGVRDIRIRPIGTEGDSSSIVLDFFIDTRDAMGANIINTILEKISPLVTQVTDSNLGIRILSNFSERRLAGAKIKIPFSVLEEKLSRKIVTAQAFAEEDVYRAVTHNKGIFNGIDAVAVATGNDTRAIEAAGHAYAARNGNYKPLTNWEIYNNELTGEILLPLQVGIVGGLTEKHEVAKLSLKILGVVSSKELSEVMAAVGLAQNFAALHALTTEGIQKGHMRMHSRRVTSE